jgi:glycosyltransferase involved in cell wall biosynthesis
MEQNKVTEEQLHEIINKITSKDFNIYFFTLDTKGNAVAGVANIYEHVKLLTELGYNAHILHEKNDYKIHGDEHGLGVVDWLGEEYGTLPHVSIESQELKVKPEDFMIVPEVFSPLMEQTKHFPCIKIVLSQSPEYIFELLPIGRRWTDYGYNTVITTSEKQENFINTLFPSAKTYTVPVSIPTYFTDSNKPKQPVICIHTRNQSDTIKIVKQFYLQYPLYKWVSFKDLRGLSRREFANELGKSCLAVWVDDVAGFGTFPLEAIECNTPVIGKAPNTIPEWMEEYDENGTQKIVNNGIWTNTTNNIPELIATYLKLWLEDNVPTDLYETMETTKGKYTVENQKSHIEKVYGEIFHNRTEAIKDVINGMETETTK